VRRLFALAPPGEGVSRIRFFNVGVAASQLGWQREHPLSDLLTESVVAAPDANGHFEFAVSVDGAPVLAVWLSADGDDTQSSFSVTINRLELHPVPPSPD
jgi:hypothetical protein